MVTGCKAESLVVVSIVYQLVDFFIPSRNINDRSQNHDHIFAILRYLSSKPFRSLLQNQQTVSYAFPISFLTSSQDQLWIHLLVWHLG